jgi:hypothetical protein
MSDADIPTTTLFGREPALIVGLAQAVLNLVAIPFKLDSAFIGAANAVLVAFAAVLVRANVYPKQPLDVLAGK